jgi:hypothetical protein
MHCWGGDRIKSGREDSLHRVPHTVLNSTPPLPSIEAQQREVAIYG